MLFKPDRKVMGAYARPLTERDYQDVPALLLAHAQVCGGDPELASWITLGDAMRTAWETDAHIVQYAPTNDHEWRHRKRDQDIEIAFHFAMFDLDFKNHHEDRQQAEDFNRLLRICSVIDNQPNFVYPTWGGARIGFIIKPTDDPVWFESRYQALLAILADLFKLSGSGYAVDQTKDWTRLFRLPRVMRTKNGEEKPTHDTPILIFHDELFDLATLKVKEKPPRKPLTGTAVWHGRDPYLSALMSTIRPGERHHNLLKACTFILKKYQRTDADGLIEECRRLAYAASDDHIDTDKIIESAYLYNQL